MTAHSYAHAAPGAAPRPGPLLGAARFVVAVYLFAVAGLLLTTLATAVVAGWQPLAVVSGSMRPALSPGAVVLVAPASADRFYDHPTIVASEDPARAGRLVTHRVTDSAVDEDGAVSYLTKGDANRVADSSAVPHTAVVGSVRMVVPFVGLPALWVHQGNLPALTAWGLGTLLAVGVLVWGRGR